MNLLPFFFLYASLAVTGNHSVPLQDSVIVKSSHHKMTIAQVLKKYSGKWMEIPGVTGTGEGKSEGKPCVMVLVDHKSPLIKKKIPNVIDGYKVVLEETGKIQARTQQ